MFFYSSNINLGLLTLLQAQSLCYVLTPLLRHSAYALGPVRVAY